MRAIFVFWDVTYLEELTLNFSIADYKGFGHQGAMSGIKPEEDIDQQKLS
jgi:hypothetical protein